MTKIEDKLHSINALQSFLSSEADITVSCGFKDKVLRLAQDQEQNILMLNTLKNARDIMNTRYCAPWVFYGYAPKSDQRGDITICFIPINNGGVAVVFHNWEIQNIPVPTECPVGEALEMSGISFLEDAVF